MSGRFGRIRHPAVAGHFYPSSEEELILEIERCFKSDIGPGRIPEPRLGTRSLIGLVSPHAGYVYSGPVAAHGFKYLAEDGLPETIIIIGPNHTGVGSGVSLYDSGVWKTPLGDVDIDDELADRIRNMSNLIDIDYSAHQNEHSIEVQIPFIQYIYRKMDKTFNIVPIVLMMQDINTAVDVGRAIYEGIKSIARDVVIIASTDFTHYEPHKIASEKDRYAIDAILSLDYEKLIREIYSRDISMCGFGPVAAMLYAAKLLGAGDTKLLKYATSGDVTKDYSSVVAYASIAILK